jgi:hypothetical protein
MTSRAPVLWLGLAGAITLLAGGGYVVAQQLVRHAADHPQVEMARDAAAKLGAGATPESVLPKRAVDISNPNASDPYLIVLDSSGTVLASSVTMQGEQPLPPPGVFDHVRAHGEDVITWQPAQGVRSAIVVDAYSGGFVVAGRSLLATESLEANLLAFAGLGWVGAVLVLLALAWLVNRRSDGLPIVSDGGVAR